MANESFTFWANMKDVIDTYNSEHKKYRLYDAITEYGLYGVWPEDDGTDETTDIIAIIQSLMPSLDRSRNYEKKQIENGAKGGRAQKISDEQIEEGIILATKKAGKVPSRNDVVSAIKELFGIEINTKTLSRRFGDERKKELANSVLQGHKLCPSETLGQNGDKIYVPQNSGTLGHNRDISYVSEGQKRDIRDKTNVPEGQNLCLFDF